MIDKWRELKQRADTISISTRITGALGFTLFKHGRCLYMLGTDKERADNLQRELDSLFENMPGDVVSQACLMALLKKRLSEEDAEAEVNEFVLFHTRLEGQEQ